MYILDTDILSNLLKPAPSIALVAKLASVPGERQFTTGINLGELVYGAFKRQDRTHRLLAKIRELPRSSVLPFDDAAARRYGEIRAELERRGTPVGDADLRIAAIALARSLTVVTSNVQHFQKVPGLKIENWLEG